MSIGKIQDKILTQKGCGTAIAIGMAFIMSFFIFGQCARFSGAPSGDNQNAASASPVATVGDIPVTVQQVNDQVTRMTQGQPGTSFASEAQETSNVLSQLLSSAADQYIAERDHVNIDDKALLNAASTVLDQQMEMQKMQLQLKPGASQAEVDAALKKRTGMTSAEMKKKALENVQAGLAKPGTRAALLNELISPALQDAITSSTKVSEADLRSNYDTYSIKRILISKTPGVDAKAKADQALKAVQGGMPFETAIDKFSGEPPQAPAKKARDNIQRIPRATMSYRPSFKALIGQKAGYVSGVVDEPEGYAIYKITAITNEPPRDFDTNKEKYRKEYLQSQVQQKLQDETKAILDSKDVKWDNKGYEALYDFSKTYTMTPQERTAALARIAQEGQDAMKDPASKQAGLEAWFEAETAEYQDPANKAKLVQGRIDVLNAVLDSNEDYDLRNELIDLYIQQKKGKEALQNLIAAMQANTTYDDQGQRRFGDLSAKAQSLVKSKLITEADLKPFEDAQAAWKKSKADEDQNNIQMAQQEAAQKAEDAANEKANEEALKKQKAEGAKTSGKASSPATPAPAVPTKATIPVAPKAGTPAAPAGSLTPPKGKP